MKTIIRLTVFLSVLFLFGCESITDKEIDEQISRSERLSRLKALCESLPKPNLTEYRYKRLSGNSDVSLLIYYYSKKIPFKEVDEFYSDWFARNGWKRNLELASTNYGYYGKDGFEVAITAKSADSLEIGCQVGN